jgi:cytochrome c553
VKIHTLVFGAALLSAQLAIAQPAKASPMDFQTTMWAASCMACHGTDGRAEGVELSLNGRPSERLFEALLAFKSGKRIGTVMHQHAKGYSDDELKRLAYYFSQIR